MVSPLTDYQTYFPCNLKWELSILFNAVLIKTWIIIEFMYNYARIETLVDKEDINDAVMNASYILSTVKFNPNVIKLMLNEDYFTNKEENYDEFTSKKSEVETDNFLQYSDQDNEKAKEEENKDWGVEKWDL